MFFITAPLEKEGNTVFFILYSLFLIPASDLAFVLCTDSSM
jgi:hypothetical protein